MYDPDYPRLRPLIVREANRQLIAPAFLIRLRIYLYYNLNRTARKGGVDLLWIKLHYDIRERAVEDGLLREAPKRPHGPWLYPPDRKDEALDALDRRVELYENWRNQLSGKAGAHGPVLIREALRLAGFYVVERPVTVPFEGEPWEIDILTLSPLRLAIEVKNKHSDAYHAPQVAPYPTEDLEQIQRHFRAAHALDLIPVLAASLIDRTFRSFAYRFGGLYHRMLFQYVPADEAEACEVIREEFRFGHLRATDEPPPWMLKWFRRLPTLYGTTYPDTML